MTRRDKLTSEFTRDLRAYGKGLPVEAARDSTHLANVMRKVAPSIGELAVNILPEDVLFLKTTNLADSVGKTIGKGWQISGQRGDFDRWRESRGYYGDPNSRQIALGLALAKLGEDWVLREFEVPPPGHDEPIKIVSVCGGMPTGDDWPLGSMDHRREPFAAAMNEGTYYKDLVSFAHKLSRTQAS